MKTRITVAAMLLVLAGVFCPFYSSAENPEDYAAWAENNAEYYSEAPRSEFVTLNFSRQRALYELFSPQKKAALWRYKWKDIRQSDLLSGAEKKELKKFYRMATSDVFDDNDPQAHSVFATGSENLGKTMVEKFGWDEKKIFTYLECWMTEGEIRAYCRGNNLRESDFL